MGGLLPGKKKKKGLGGEVNEREWKREKARKDKRGWDLVWRWGVFFS
jgi:hypothetical protein